MVEIFVVVVVIVYCDYYFWVDLLEVVEYVVCVYVWGIIGLDCVNVGVGQECYYCFWNIGQIGYYLVVGVYIQVVQVGGGGGDLLVQFFLGQGLVVVQFGVGFDGWMCWVVDMKVKYLFGEIQLGVLELFGVGYGVVVQYSGIGL